MNTSLRMLVVAVALGSGCGGEPPAVRPQSDARQASRLKSDALQASRPKLATAAPVCQDSGAHQKHFAMNLSCSVCHPCGGQFGFTAANAYTYPKGTSTAGGTLVRSTATTPANCTVACHYPTFTSVVATPHSVDWTAPGPLACTACHDPRTFTPAHPDVSGAVSRADCDACHDDSRHTAGTVTLVAHVSGWMTQTDPDFHAYSAERGLANCRQCHLADLSGGFTGFSCAQCHDTKDATGTTVSWKTNCTMCHGGTDNASGAPPKNVWGYSADAVRTGAHTAHLSGSAFAPAYGCEMCHVKPADALAAGHIDDIAPGATPLATITFTGLATQGTNPSWDRASARCNNTYCHGSTLAGGTNTTPAWIAGPSQATCGTCHGLPPPNPPHPVVSSDLTLCTGCHAQTIDATGALIPPPNGKHLNGNVEAAGHTESWMDQNSPGFHAYSANLGLDQCKSCHGADLSGGAGPACGNCHDMNLPAGVTSWKLNCTMCHGGMDNSTGAPPRATWGKDSDAVRTGAHTAHVWSTQSASPSDCGVCHVKPNEALSPGHVDGPTATVTFAGTAVQGGVSPGWNRGAATCASTYCHGATLTGGNATTPIWTRLDGSQKACTACHGKPPPTGRHSLHVGSWSIPCWACHPGAWNVPVQPASHVDGTVELNPKGGYFGTFSDWSATSAGTGTLRGTATGCHRGQYYWTGRSPTGSCN